MSFSADWLALRAGADDRARDRGLLDTLAQYFEGREALRVLDLGSGTGANLRATAPYLPGTQKWRLVDNDPALLGKVQAPEKAIIETRQFDLSDDLGPLFDPRPDLVTASAFFDLCGEAVIRNVLEQTVANGVAFYTVLTYDGLESWEPSLPSDGDVLEAFHADQRRDKGLGSALGPDATAALVHAFEANGYAVATARSDWVLSQPEDAALIVALAQGSADAVRPALGPKADEWGAERRNARSVRIGHLDLLALPRP